MVPVIFSMYAPKRIECTRVYPGTSDWSQNYGPASRLDDLQLRGLRNSSLNSMVLDKSYTQMLNLDNNHILYVKDMDNYNLIKTLLQEVDIQYYTYTPKQNKPKNIVLKGMDMEYSEAEIREALVALSLEDVTFTRVEMLNQRNRKRVSNNLNVAKKYIVQITNESNYTTITKICTLLQ